MKKTKSYPSDKDWTSHLKNRSLLPWLTSWKAIMPLMSLRNHWSLWWTLLLKSGANLLFLTLLNLWITWGSDGVQKCMSSSDIVSLFTCLALEQISLSSPFLISSWTYLSLWMISNLWSYSVQQTFSFISTKRSLLKSMMWRWAAHLAWSSPIFLGYPEKCVLKGFCTQHLSNRCLFSYNWWHLCLFLE